MTKFQIVKLCVLVALLGACSLPGMKYQNGGSDAWRGSPGEPGYDSTANLKVLQITPGLVAHLRKRSADMQAKRQSAAQSQELPPPWEYRVGAGDILSVIVWDHPELTNPTGTTLSVESSGRVVQPDGSMFYPHVGTINVAGNTLEEIRQMITMGLAPIIENPQVDVRILQFRSQFVNVVGDVNQPCKLAISDTPMTVIDAMNQCSTIRPAVGNRDLILKRNGESYQVDLHQVYRGQNPLLYHPLKGGDSLYVQDDRKNRIFVVGEVNRQASLRIPVSGMTLADAINSKEVEGLNQVTVNASNIYVFRGGMQNIKSEDGKVDTQRYQPRIYHLDAKSPDALLLADHFKLKPRDIVYASSASLVNYSRAASLVIPTITTLIQTGILIDRL